MTTPLALVVDITCTAPQYDVPLSKALAVHGGVVFRTSPLFADPDMLAGTPIRQDLLPSANRIARRWSGVTRRPLLWKLLRLGGYVNGCYGVITEVCRQNIPILHFQWCKLPFFDLHLMRRAQKRGVRVVYTVHNALPHGDRRESTRRAYQALYRQADALIVLSGSVGRSILEWVDGSVAEKIYVIEHGILELASPLPLRAQARDRLKLNEQAEVVLFMGAISAYKGIADLIDAFAKAKQHRPHLRLIIAGREDEPFGPYKNQIEGLGVASDVLTFPRYVSEEFKSTLYSASDLSVLPHRDPSQSAMGLEGLAAGKPLIVTRGGGLLDLIDEDVNGFSVPIGDVHAMADALTRFFELPRGCREAMGAASRRIGRDRFGWSAIARKHIQLYRKLAAVESVV